MPKFKVDILSNCKVCGSKITNKRSRSYCSTECRNKYHNEKNRAYQSSWQKERNDRLASKPSANKIKCEICGKYYVQVCSHIVQAHKVVAREYRETYGLDVKRGLVPGWYRELKADICERNGTIKNLEAGARYRFKKGDKVGKYERSQQTLERLSHKNKRTF